MLPAEDLFPDQLKQTNVIPLYRTDNPMLFDHCQRLSLLCLSESDVLQTP